MRSALLTGGGLGDGWQPGLYDAVLGPPDCPREGGLDTGQADLSWENGDVRPWAAP